MEIKPSAYYDVDIHMTHGHRVQAEMRGTKLQDLEKRVGDNTHVAVWTTDSVPCIVNMRYVLTVYYMERI